MSDINLKNITVTRLLLIRELERHYGQRDFTISQMRELNSIHASGCLSSHMAVNGGWIKMVGRGKYRLTKKAFDLVRHVKEQLQ